MKKNEALIVFSNLGLGGVQRKIVDMVNYAAKSKKYDMDSLHLVLRDRERFNFDKALDTKFGNVVYYSGSRLLNIKGLRKFKNLAYCRFLIRLIKERRPKTVYVFFHFSMPCFLVARWLRLVPDFRLIVSQDNILSFYNKSPHVKRVYPSCLIRFLYKQADMILVQTKYAKQDLRSKYEIDGKKVVVVPNWLMDTKYPLLKKDIDLIYCGRFARQKRLELLLEVVAAIKKERSGVKLVMIGDGDEKKMVLEIVKKLRLETNVEVVNPTHELKQWLARSKLFVLTSEFEGQPMVLLEAMAARSVPVCLRYPGLDEYLVDKKVGYICETKKEMVGRIVRLLENERERKKIENATRSYVLKKYNWRLIDKNLSLMFGERND